MVGGIWVWVVCLLICIGLWLFGVINCVSGLYWCGFVGFIVEVLLHFVIWVLRVRLVSCDFQVVLLDCRAAWDLSVCLLCEFCLVWFGVAGNGCCVVCLFALGGLLGVVCYLGLCC